MTAMFYFLLFSFVFKNLTNYGRRHLKPFTTFMFSGIHCMFYNILGIYISLPLSPSDIKNCKKIIPRNFLVNLC